MSSYQQLKAPGANQLEKHGFLCFGRVFEDFAGKSHLSAILLKGRWENSVPVPVQTAEFHP